MVIFMAKDKKENSSERIFKAKSDFLLTLDGKNSGLKAIKNGQEIDFLEKEDLIASLIRGNLIEEVK
jgi:hypothetical protein